MERERYAAVSVGEDWRERFDAACEAAVTVWESPQREEAACGALWGFGNEIILGTALRRAREWGGDVVLAAVWDGRIGDGAGGTADLVARAAAAGVPMWALNPRDDEAGRSLTGNEGGAVRTMARFCVHASGVEWSEAVESAVAGGSDVVELDADLRVFFGTAAAAVAGATGLRRAVPGVGIGLSAGVASDERRGHLTAQATGLARAARNAGGVLAGWEFAALAGVNCGAVFEAAGRSLGGAGD